MSELVCSPVSGSPRTGYVVVCKTSSPHYLRTITIVVRIVEHGKHTVFHRSHKRFRHTVHKRHVVVFREITLQRVHDDVRNAGCRLIRRKRICALGVHHGELTAAQVACIAEFDVAVFVCYHTAVAHLATGCGYGKYGTYGHARLRYGPSQVEVPHVTVVSHTVSYCLCRVYYRASADGNDKVYALAATQVYALVHLGKTRIGHHAAQQDMLYACRRELTAHLIEKSRTARTFSAIMHKNLCTTMMPYQLCYFLFRLCSEHHFGGSVKTEIFHCVIFFMEVKK